jgi:hypothetical protein
MVAGKVPKVHPSVGIREKYILFSVRFHDKRGKPVEIIIGASLMWIFAGSLGASSLFNVIHSFLK